MARFTHPGIGNESGLPGPQGPQGEIGPAGADGAPGANGADALWNFVGEYNNGADYNIGDIVTYNGGTYYRVGEPNPGYPPGTVYWTTIAEPGALGAQGPQGEIGPAGDTGDQGPQGIQGEPGVSGTTGLESWTRYSPTFAATGLSFTGSNSTYPTYNSYYVKAGKLVSFVIEVDCSTVTNFGTGQYKLQLPFTPAVGFNHFTGWAHVDTAVNPDVENGHVILNADHSGITDILDLHYLKQSGGAKTAIVEGLFLQGTPVILTSSSKIYVNGTYISA